MFKNRSLAMQIWAVFTMMLIGSFLLVILVLPIVLRSFFTDDVYGKIQEVQTHYLMDGDVRPEGGPHSTPPNGPKFEIRNLVLFQKSKSEFNNSPFSNVNQIEKQATAQKKTTQKYAINVNNKEIFYIIYKTKKITLLTYAPDDSRNTLSGGLFKQIFIMMGFVLVLSFPFSLVLSRYLSEPLVQIEKHLRKMANREWDTSLLLGRKDEVGKLALSIEHLRKRLIKHDQKQQFFMQHVSHELKTPVMVIRSYVSAIEDGIYPKGSLSESLKVINKQIIRLEKRIKDLLYLTKLNYLSDEKLANVSLSIDEIVKEVVDNYSCQRSDVIFDLQLIPIQIKVDKDQMITAFSNIVQNQMRYAEKQNVISMSVLESQLNIEFVNDGNPIDLEDPNLVFEPFYKGEKGQFGLGLAITKRIIDLYKGGISVENRENGVAFTISLPIKDNEADESNNKI